MLDTSEKISNIMSGWIVIDDKGEVSIQEPADKNKEFENTKTI